MRLGQPTRFYGGVPVAPWIHARLLWARRKGWRGRVISGVRTRETQARLYREWQLGQRAGPVAPPGQSNHEGTRWPRGAVDVSEPEELERILRSQPRHWRKLRWYGPADRWHFSSSGR